MSPSATSSRIARRHALEDRHGQDLEAEALQELEVAGAPTAEPKVLAGDRDLGSDRAQHLLRELLRLEPSEVERELDDHGRLDTQLLDELHTTLERGEEVDPVPERSPRMRVERQDGRLGPRGERRFDHQPMAQVDAVERPERDHARDGLEPIDAPRDLHLSSAARASAGATIRSGSASATSKDPTWVRLRLTQWPPSASATART